MNGNGNRNNLINRITLDEDNESEISNNNLNLNEETNILIDDYRNYDFYYGNNNIDNNLNLFNNFLAEEQANRNFLNQRNNQQPFYLRNRNQNMLIRNNSVENVALNFQLPHNNSNLNSAHNINHDSLLFKNQKIKKTIQEEIVENKNCLFSTQNCVICFGELVVDLASTYCGHVMHKKCLERCFARKHYCPICRFKNGIIIPLKFELKKAKIDSIIEKG